jgi:hypothetical protein
MADLWNIFFKKLEKITEGKTNAESLNYATHISLKHKYIFIETPKVACSTIKISLQRLELEKESFNRDRFEDVHVREFSPLLQLTQLPDFEEYLERNDFFKFCFVRNPYSRLLSCYLDKILNPTVFKEKESVLAFMGLNINDIDYPISFGDFVSVIEKQSLLEMDYHWRPQTYLTCQSTIKYDFIGKLENFENDFNHASKYISPELDKYYSPEVRHQTGANKRLQKYYDDDLFERVYNIYEVDFVNFSYTKTS